MALCRSCQARIIWCRTPTGGSMPVDADPTPDGNVVMVDGRAVVTTDPPPGARRFTSHFATCPNAGEWRGR